MVVALTLSTKLDMDNAGDRRRGPHLLDSRQQPASDVGAQRRAAHRGGSAYGRLKGPRRFQVHVRGCASDPSQSYEPVAPLPLAAPEPLHVCAATLYASIAFCAALLLFLAVAASTSDSDSRRSRGPSLSFTYFPDFWMFTDPSPRHRSRSRGRSRSRSDATDELEKGKKAGLSFMQAVTAWVFGEGDANAGFDNARWAAAAKYIQAHGGVVAAEEMRPFMDSAAPHDSVCASPLRSSAARALRRPPQAGERLNPFRRSY